METPNKIYNGASKHPRHMFMTQNSKGMIYFNPFLYATGCDILLFGGSTPKTSSFRRVEIIRLDVLLNPEKNETN